MNAPANGFTAPTLHWQSWPHPLPMVFIPPNYGLVLERIAVALEYIAAALSEPMKVFNVEVK